MIEQILKVSNNLMNKFDMRTIVVYPSDDGTANVSCSSMNGKVFIYVNSIGTGYNEPEFAINHSVSLSSLLSIVSNDFSIKLERNSNDYPFKMIVKSGSIKVNHYLQPFNMISSQVDLLNTYKNHKFKLSKNISTSDFMIPKEEINNLSKLASFLNEITFSLKTKEDGLYIVLGDDDKTVDNGCIKINGADGTEFSGKYKFVVSDFINLYKSFSSYDVFKMKISEDKIYFYCKNDYAESVGILIGVK